MPRALWRRRRATDSPRPAGRRWTGKLRSGGTLARQVLLVRVARRRLDGTAGVSLRRPAGFGRLGGPADRLATLDAPPVGGAASVTGMPSVADPMAPVEPSGVSPVAAVAPVGPAVPGGAPLVVPLLPGVPTPARRLAFLVVNGCTLTSLLLGLMAILLAMRGDVRSAALCLVACVVFDGLDGALARRLGVASPFGAQLDSLADMCAFGVAAPVVVYASLAGRVSPRAAAVACAFVAAGAAVRLARFNVSPRDGRFFCGVPTTMAACVLALAVLIDLPVSGQVELTGVALLAFAMVSTFPYAKLARLVTLPPWVWIAPLAGAVVDAQLTFASVVGVYLASGPLLWLHRRRAA